MRSNIDLDLPLDIWLNTKICLPNQKRGLAIAKITQDLSSGEYRAVLTCDKALLGEKAEKKNLLHFEQELGEYFQNAIDNLSELTPGTVLVFAPPQIYGTKVWFARVEKLVNTHINDMQSMIQYSIIDLQEVKDFREARRNTRISYRTQVDLHLEDSEESLKLYSYNISQNGIALINQPKETKFEFITDQEYLLEITLHEGYHMPPLKYRCAHIRDDIISNSQIIGFELVDTKKHDPQIQENFNLLTWAMT